MKRLLTLVSAGLALAVAVAAGQALQAPEREPVGPIELLIPATRDAHDVPSTPSLTPTPDRTGPATTPATQPAVNDDRTERRTPIPPRRSPVPSRGDGDDDDEDDEDED